MFSFLKLEDFLVFLGAWSVNGMRNEAGLPRLSGMVEALPVATVGLRDFPKKKELMFAGIRAAEKAVPRILAKIGNVRRS
jgi:hypothetical protein